ncbi:MAG: Na-translocating system protein MpsC family protein [Solirubrobacterales bacterium]
MSDERVPEMEKNEETPAATDAGGAGEDERDSVRAEISRQMVRIYKEQFGRGPTKVRTDFAGPDVVVTTLESSFTPAERRLVEMGEDQRMRDTRLYFQHATEALFRETVEEILGRRVRAFLSGLDAAEDVSAEVFYLEQ